MLEFAKLLTIKGKDGGWLSFAGHMAKSKRLARG